MTLIIEFDYLDDKDKIYAKIFPRTPKQGGMVSSGLMLRLISQIRFSPFCNKCYS